MKVALIGNMNNNFFSILMYLRDMNIDATLYLFKNDGIDDASHFSCESDTFEIDKWRDYIKRTEIFNSQSQVISYYAGFNILFILLYVFLKLISSSKANWFRPSKFFLKKYIRKKFSKYDVIIGTGNIPSLFYLAGLNLDIYAPYSFGLEYFNCVNTNRLLNSKNILIRYFAKKIRRFQYNGFKNSKILNTQFGITLETLNSYNLEYLPIDYPMVYLSKNHLKLASIEDRYSFSSLDNYDFIVLSHSRHLWVKPDNENITFEKWNEYENKNNDWLIFSFSKLVKKYPEKKLLLILIDYGRDATHTRKLCENLNLNNNVMWLPKLERKYILQLISKVNVVATDFYTGKGIMWGGAGWETLIMGKPFIVGFNFTNNSFEEYFDFPPPDLLPVKEENDIYIHLEHLLNDETFQIKNGEKNKDWFYKYNGYEITKRWIEILK